MHPEQDESPTFRPLVSPMKEDDFGMRLDTYLTKKFPFLSRAQWHLRVERGDVKVCGGIVRPSYKVRESDVFTYLTQGMAEPEVDSGIYPLFKMGPIMAVYKPGNLPMHENGAYRTHTFAFLLHQEFGKDWHAVHRLDKETSGIVLCSNDASIRTKLSDLFAAGDIDKEYLAISRGPAPFKHFREMGAIGDLVGSTIRIKKWVVPPPLGLPAETWFDVLETKGIYSLIRARPKTGRTNQIRIHLAVNQLPILGDKLYHEDETVFDEYFLNRGNTERVVRLTGFKRLCLHAYRISFVNPVDHEPVVITCPMPDEIAEFWGLLDDISGS